ncbi:MAG: GNAT family N-acetyltransferase [Myxococcota bacterium]|nr:GNAT family N-acetyltransferase [Myxococcota bacterium]
MSDPPSAADVLETPRLRLRPPRDEDVEPLFAIQGDADAMRFTFHARDREATRRHLRAWDRTRTREGWAPWTVLAKEDGAVIGWGGLGRDPDDPRWGPEVVYFLRRDRWGRGLATELARAALRLAFEERGLREVTAFVRPENAASQRVLAKCGFRRVGPVPELGRDRYTVTGAAWRAACGGRETAAGATGP